MRTDIFVSCAVQIEAKGYEAAPYRGIRLPTRLAASSAMLDALVLKRQGGASTARTAWNFALSAMRSLGYLRGALGGVNLCRIRKSFGGFMSQLGSAEIGAYRIRRGADFRSHRKIWICFAADTAALLRKILTLRPPRKRSMVKFRR